MWTVITKDKTEIPESVAKYRDFKPYLRNEADHKCIYCATKESYLGGSDSFHVEHFRPKSIDEFKHLIKEYTNLFYACAICNRFKSNDWPSEPNEEFNIPFYIDPNLYDYNRFFTITENYTVEGKNVSASYLIERINLNRPQLINVRRETILRAAFPDIYNTFNNLLMKLNQLEDQKGKELLHEALELIQGIMTMWSAEKDTSQYEPSEIKR